MECAQWKIICLTITFHLNLKTMLLLLFTFTALVIRGVLNVYTMSFIIYVVIIVIVQVSWLVAPDRDKGKWEIVTAVFSQSSW